MRFKEEKTSAVLGEIFFFSNRIYLQRSLLIFYYIFIYYYDIPWLWHYT